MKGYVVTGTDSKVYYGEAHQLPVVGERGTLQNVWQLLVLDNAIVDQRTGQHTGTARSFMLMSLYLSRSALPELHIQVASVMDVEKSGLQDTFEALKRQALAAMNPERPAIIRAPANALAALEHTK